MPATSDAAKAGYDSSDDEISTETIVGSVLLARSLKQQGVDFMFGVVGFPVDRLAREAQKRRAALRAQALHGSERLQP